MRIGSGTLLAGETLRFIVKETTVAMFLPKQRYTQSTAVVFGVNMAPATLTFLLMYSLIRNLVLGEEICLDETFIPSCSPDHVVVMTSAVYGRMRLGRCIETDFGHIGCRADALQLMDATCSGVTTCSFKVATEDTGLKDISKCPKELMSFLDVDYSCTKVDTSPRYCTGPIQLDPSESSGVIPSHMTDTSRCGSLQAPWRVAISPGQKLNISLMDFGWHIPQHDNATRLDNPRCDPYGYVVEGKLGINKTICGGGKRQEHVHLSASNQVDISLLSSRQRKQENAFLVIYTVVGCPDLTPPAHAWYKREGDSARIGCEWNHNSWHLTCEGNSWSGVVGNCSAPAKTPSSTTRQMNSPISPVLSIALIIGLGVLAVTLVCILLVGCIYFKRRSHRRPPLAPDLAKCGTMVEQHSLVRRYQPGQGAPGMSDNPSGALCGPPPQQPYPVRCGTGPHGMTASRAPPQPWDRSLPNPRGGPPTWGAGPQPDYSCPRPRGGQGGTLIKDKDKELDTSDSGSDYYWAGTHKYHVLDKDKPDWSQ